ncbi:MAG: DUF429 domain-containing protein [Thermoplasmata archaeon]|nr:DUF429 domain-containing protein [Thermoplasmata archaeon]
MVARAPVVGLDLAGRAHRSTGFCLLAGNGTARTLVLHDDDDIVRRCRSSRPGVVVIDAPLSLPVGRRTLEDRGGPHLRACDRELLLRRIRFFPLTLGPMRLLTARGIELAARLGTTGFTVIEGYPGGAQDVWGIPRKGTDLDGLRAAIARLGIRFLSDVGAMTHDELDAVCLALVGRQFLEHRAEALGDPAEGLLYLPGQGRPFGPFHAGANDAEPSRPARTNGAKRRRRAGLPGTTHPPSAGRSSSPSYSGAASSRRRTLRRISSRSERE